MTEEQEPNGLLGVELFGVFDREECGDPMDEGALFFLRVT